ncbi:MAG: hypothetical protein Q8K58_13875 [Acidimicrobiales bacterium]|nr:hypothetical protein [Acidimicrobiales bacterium]
MEAPGPGTSARRRRARRWGLARGARPHLDFDLGLFLSNLRDVNSQATVLQVSARTGEGVDP